MFNRATKSAAVWLAALAALGAAATARAESLDGALRDRAPEVLAFLRKAPCNNVGVLKFRVRHGKGERDDDSGAVSLDVAQHLAVALVLAEKPGDDEVGVIRDADAVAAGLRGANHLDDKPEVRRRLFDADTYPLAHSDRKVRPDGFLTGKVVFGDDLHTVTVRLQYMDREGQFQDVFDQDHLIHADTDSANLIGLGYPFLRREIDFKTVPADPPNPSEKANPDTQAIQSTLEIAAKKENILASKDAPVQLAIFYGNEKIEPSFKEGKDQTASIPEPQGKRVVFQIKRAPGAKGRYGVVLLVNGLNTLYQEPLRSDYRTYAKWVLEPDAGPIEISGFQTDKNSDKEFQVLSPTESRANEIKYGNNVGKITLVVFREKRDGDEREPGNKEVTAVRRGLFPDSGAAQNLEALQDGILLSVEPRKVRGIIVAGTDKKESRIREVDFEAAPDPLMTATITYYHP